MNFRLLIFLAFSSIATFAMQMPILRDGTFYANNQRVVRGSLNPLVTGGKLPYLFVPEQATNGDVTLDGRTDQFTFTFDANATGPGTFSYFVLFNRGEETNPATVTIYPGQEKG